MAKVAEKVVYDSRSIKLGHEVTVEGVTWPSKSVAIKSLHDEGMSNGDIAKVLGIRYQFVYNVLKRAGK
ncbi:MAG: hypothetical protein LC687_02060 [Actinobacteria bacterium]|nr:hypothetical protein [Actinomycetota bacterium]